MPRAQGLVSNRRVWRLMHRAPSLQALRESGWCPGTSCACVLLPVTQLPHRGTPRNRSAGTVHLCAPSTRRGWLAHYSARCCAQGTYRVLKILTSVTSPSDAKCSFTRRSVACFGSCRMNTRDVESAIVVRVAQSTGKWRSSLETDGDRAAQDAVVHGSAGVGHATTPVSA